MHTQTHRDVLYMEAAVGAGAGGGVRADLAGKCETIYLA